MTIEYAAAVLCALLVLATATHGGSIGVGLAVAGAWLHNPVLVLVGVVVAALSRPLKNGGDDGGRTKHA